MVPSARRRCCRFSHLYLTLSDTRLSKYSSEHPFAHILLQTLVRRHNETLWYSPLRIDDLCIFCRTQGAFYAYGCLEHDPTAVHSEFVLWKRSKEDSAPLEQCWNPRFLVVPWTSACINEGYRPYLLDCILYCLLFIYWLCCELHFVMEMLAHSQSVRVNVQ